MIPPRPRVLLEIAADDIAGAAGAARAGADRIELCAALCEGGLTPSPGVLRQVKVRVGVPVFAMIRPRGGGFVLAPAELEAMTHDIEVARQCGADGVVLGALTAAGEVDRAAVRQLVRAAQHLPVTFHRAFDRVRDPTQALEDLIDLGCARVLTSGGAATASAGAERLHTLVAQARGRLTIVAGGSVRAAGLAAVLATGVTEVHAGPRAAATDQGTTTDLDEVRALAAQLGR